MKDQLPGGQPLGSYEELSCSSSGWEDTAGALRPGADPLAGALAASIDRNLILGPSVLHAVAFVLGMGWCTRLLERPPSFFVVFWPVDPFTAHSHTAAPSERIRRSVSAGVKSDH